MKKRKKYSEEEKSILLKEPGVRANCPCCAAEENDDGLELGYDGLIRSLRMMAENGGLMVFDPVSRKCLSDEDIQGVCMNGNCIQITLSENWNENYE